MINLSGFAAKPLSVSENDMVSYRQAIRRAQMGVRALVLATPRIFYVSGSGAGTFTIVEEVTQTFRVLRAWLHTTTATGTTARIQRTRAGVSEWLTEALVVAAGSDGTITPFAKVDYNFFDLIGGDSIEVVISGGGGAAIVSIEVVPN
jgi:hypothetical protein